MIRSEVLKKFITLSVTILIIGSLHGITAFIFDSNFVDIAIPFGLAAIFLAYIFTNKGGALSRQMDMHIQGETGIRIATTKKVTSQSFVFLGSIVYFSLALLLTLYFYKDYFID